MSPSSETALYLQIYPVRCSVTLVGTLLVTFDPMKPILIKPLTEITEMVQKTWSVLMSSNFYNCIIINSLHLQIFPSTVLGNPCWSFIGIGSTCFQLNNFRLHFSLSTVVWTVWRHFLTTLAYLRSSIELLRSDHLWKNLQQSCIFNSPWGCAANEFYGLCNGCWSSNLYSFGEA